MFHLIGIALIVLGILIFWKAIRKIGDTLSSMLFGKPEDKGDKP
jgi:hypothetical protein